MQMDGILSDGRWPRSTTRWRWRAGTTGCGQDFLLQKGLLEARYDPADHSL